MRQAMQAQPCAAFKINGVVPYACRHPDADCQCKKNGIIVSNEENNGIINLDAPVKPTVQYISIADRVAIGVSTFVIPLNHPYCSNNGWVMTTPVQSFVSDGKGVVSFETLNTKYVRA